MPSAVLRAQRVAAAAAVLVRPILGRHGAGEGTIPRSNPGARSTAMTRNFFALQREGDRPVE